MAKTRKTKNKNKSDDEDLNELTEAQLLQKAIQASMQDAFHQDNVDNDEDAIMQAALKASLNDF